MTIQREQTLSLCASIPSLPWWKDIWKVKCFYSFWPWFQLSSGVIDIPTPDWIFKQMPPRAQSLSNLLSAISGRFWKFLTDMNIFNVVSNSPSYAPTIPKNFWTEISATPQISTDFEPHTIIEFHIYGFILPILKAILGKNMAKCGKNA